MEKTETNITCDDFVFCSDSSTSNVGGITYSCDRIPKEIPKKPEVTEKCETPPGHISTSSSSSTLTSGIISQNYCTMKEPLVKAPNISYELSVAKSIMQEFSTISGDNLFDHLSDIIKRIIDERPPNVIDFFEEFSRNVREQKFHLPERFPPESVYEKSRMYKVAKKQLISLKLPYAADLTIDIDDEMEEEQSRLDELDLHLKGEAYAKFLTFNDRVQHLQFFWNQCGFSISSEDIFQLACAMTRLQTHPSILQCRFWGMINGLKASYYIVEAALSPEEYESRLMQMEKEIQENFTYQPQDKVPSHIGPELTPGAIGWENHPQDEIVKMYPGPPVPVVQNIEKLDVPPEPIGKGVNRYSYFVVNSLFDDWIELPIVTPKQISLSRSIKKFFTGDLEEDVISYPCFCGKEKHYLRAMIARITAGTYIAPDEFYRKMTKAERLLFEGVDYDDELGEEEAEEEELEEEEGEEEPDNDIVLLKNEAYDISVPINSLNDINKWVHVRPNILEQGRVVWYDLEKAEREREKERLRLEKLRLQEEMGGEGKEESDNDGGEEEGEGGEEEEEEEYETCPEKGPAILSHCSQDIYKETTAPWIGRLTSKFTNKNERLLTMQSNVWPGAYTFIYNDLCESIYLGWGHKFVARNMPWTHLPPIVEEYEHTMIDFVEAIDPSVELEEAYRLRLLKKELKISQFGYEEQGEEASGDDLENDDDDDEEEE